MPDGQLESPRLRAAVKSDQLRVALGSLTMLGGGSFGFALLDRLGAPPRVMHGAERAWARAAARILRLQIDIEGTEHVNPDQAYVIVALHEGFADAIALLHLPLPLRFLVRDELFAWKTLGRYLRATDQIEVDEARGLGSLRRLYAESAKCIANGDSLVIFPQGSILGVEVAFQKGALGLAGRLGAPILPVVLSGSHRVWEHPYSPLVRLDQRVFMRVLPPVTAGAQLDLTALERRMKQIALHEATASPRRFKPDRDGWWDDYRYEIDPDFPKLAGRLAQRRASP